MILSLALRYSFSPVSHHRRRSVRIMLTAALSMAIFITVISIMDYLQGERIGRIRDVRSFDIVIEGSFREDAEAMFPDADVFVYAEKEALAEGRAVVIRYIGDDYNGSISMLRGDSSGLVVPYQLMSLSDDGTISVTMLSERRGGLVLPSSEKIPITGVYATSLGSDFDSSHIFMPISSAPEDASFMTAVKGADPDMADALRSSGYDCRSWMESESILYSAFMTEKTMMVVVLSFLFLILLVSLNGSVRIFYQSRSRERAELILLGLGRRRTAAAFILSFMIVLLSAFILSIVLSYAAIWISERYLSSLMYRAVSLSFPLSAMIVSSAVIAAVALMIAIQKECRESRKDIMEVLGER